MAHVGHDVVRLLLKRMFRSDRSYQHGRAQSRKQKEGELQVPATGLVQRELTPRDVHGAAVQSLGQLTCHQCLSSRQRSASRTTLCLWWRPSGRRLQVAAPPSRRTSAEAPGDGSTAHRETPARSCTTLLRRPLRPDTSPGLDDKSRRRPAAHATKRQRNTGCVCGARHGPPGNVDTASVGPYLLQCRVYQTGHVSVPRAADHSQVCCTPPLRRGFIEKWAAVRRQSQQQQRQRWHDSAGKRRTEIIDNSFSPEPGS
jgi:hypothetical protein